MDEEVDEINVFRNKFVIIAIILFLLFFYFYIVYTFFVKEKTPPEGENGFLYAVSQVNPINLIFGSKDEIYKPFGGGSLGYGETCPVSNNDCETCLECYDIPDDNPDLGPRCLYISLEVPRKTDTDVCDLPRFCNGLGNCVECAEHSDCIDPDKLKCNKNINFGTCVESCPEPIDCTERACGFDGCGFSCGTCDQGQTCSINGICECATDCNGKLCNEDNGCGSLCACPSGQSCNAAGTCVESPSTGGGSSGGGTGGSSGGAVSTGPKTYTPLKAELMSISGYQKKDFKKDDIIDLKNIANEIGVHKIKILEIKDIINSEKSDSVKITVYSNVQNITLFTGEKKKLDVNNDSYYDLEIQLNSVKSNKTNLTFKYIKEKIVSLITPEPDEPITPPYNNSDDSNWNLDEKPEAKINVIVIIIGIVITIMLIALMVFLITLFIKIKKVSSGKVISASPELNSVLKEQEEKINAMLSVGYDCLAKRDAANAKDIYQKIKKVYNPIYDPERNLYDKIGEFYKRILRMEGI